jgi:hypothetical protein
MFPVRFPPFIVSLTSEEPEMLMSVLVAMLLVRSISDEPEFSRERFSILLLLPCISPDPDV